MGQNIYIFEVWVKVKVIVEFFIKIKVKSPTITKSLDNYQNQGEDETKNQFWGHPVPITVIVISS